MQTSSSHFGDGLSEHLEGRAKKALTLMQRYQNLTSTQKRYVCEANINVMATDSKDPKTSVKKSSASGQLTTKSNMKAGLGLFKDKIVSESSAWEDDLRVTIKK